MITRLRIIATILRDGITRAAERHLDKARLMLQTAAAGGDPEKTSDAFDEGIKVADLTVVRALSSAIARGDDPLEVVNDLARLDAGETKVGEFIADTLERFNEGEIDHQQVTYLLGTVGIDDEDIANLTRREQCILVWMGDGGSFSHFEAPATMDGDSARAVLRAAASATISN